MKDLPARSKRILLRVGSSKISKSEAARILGISRKTVYKWLERYSEDLQKGRKAKKKSKNLDKSILKIVASNPGYGVRKIAGELNNRGYDASYTTVWKSLKELGLNTISKREDYAANFSQLEQSADPDFPGHLRLEPEARKRMVEGVLLGGRRVGEVNREFAVSRKTFAKWKKRYLESKEREENILLAMADQHPQASDHPRGAKQRTVQEVLNLVISEPKLSSHKIAQKLGSIGNHGVQNILKRHGLSLMHQRLAYAAERREEPKPVYATTGILKRARLVWEQFIPSLAPAPPPGAKQPASARIIKLLKVFSASLLTAFIIVIYWLYLFRSADSFVESVGLILATLALFMGSTFFIYSLKYYLTLALVLSFSQQDHSGESSSKRFNKGIISWILGLSNGDNGDTNGENSHTKATGLEPNLEQIKLERYPFISVHVPLFNEKNVVERVMAATANFDYKGEYEVILCDDSTDETTEIIKKYMGSFGKLRTSLGDGYSLTECEVRPGVVLKHLHRTSRSGFKGAALRLALRVVDPRTEFISVFDADFVPYPDTLELFLKYFQATTGSQDLRFTIQESGINHKSSIINPKSSRIAAVQGYQWHVLNKSENWITRGVRSEYAGSYVIERSGTEIYSGLKQISGAVYMVRRDVLEEVGWETSITEDFQLTLKLYERGYKVVYTPYIQAPAECVSTLKRLIRQRMRWAEGHSNNVRRMFTRLMLGKWESGIRNKELKNPNSSFILPNSREERIWKRSPLTLSEKLEFLYLSPYYLQAFFFLIGTMSWLISETIFAVRLPFWTSLWGWSLVLTNMLSLPLMNAVGLFLEESEERDYQGLVSFIALTYILVPFQAYAALKGFLQKEEGPWFRTPKTGRITDVFARGRFYRFISGILPGRSQVAPANLMVNGQWLMAKKNINHQSSIINHYLSLATANSRFDKPPYETESWVERVFGGFINFKLPHLGGIRIAKRYLFTKSVLAGFMAIVLFLNYMAFFVYDTSLNNAEKRTSLNNAETSQNISEKETMRNDAEKPGLSSGQVITELGAINTNLKENPEALALIPQPGEVLAAELSPGQGSTLSAQEEVYRWNVELPNGTTYSFGLQETGGIRPVVRIKSFEWWYVRFEPSIASALISDPNQRSSAVYVEPKVQGNSIEWTLSNGIVARYTVLKDRVKADYIVNDKSALNTPEVCRRRNTTSGVGGYCMDFIVQYNDTEAGATPEEVKQRPWEGHLTPELLPEGDIGWFGENGREVFNFPKPVIRESRIMNHESGSEEREWEGSYEITNISQGTSLLSIILPEDKLKDAKFPITIDPVVVDSGATATSTAYGNGRHILRDAWGNLIAVIDGNSVDDDLWYKNYNSETWTDAGTNLVLDGQIVAADIDSDGNVHTADITTSANLQYRKVPINRNGDGTISGLGSQTVTGLDSSSLTARPSIIVANKGEGAGKEKVAVAWAMNSAKGGTKRGEIRFLQCDVADGCELASEWKNASEEKNGSGTCADTGTGNVGLPNAIGCKGAADAVLNVGAHTIHHAVLTQVPGRPARTPTNAKWDDNGTFSDLTNALDDNTGTAASINSLSSTQDYLYIGDDTVFSRVVVDVTNTNDTGGGEFDVAPAVKEYWNGSAWASLANFIDNSDSAVQAFNEDGSLLFDEPSDWAKTTVDGSNVYWIRLRPDDSFDSSVSVAEFEVTDRHSKDLLIVGGVDSTDDLGAAYAIWDFVGQAGWENKPGATASPAPWRENGSALFGNAAGWSDCINFPLSLASDVLNNRIYVSYVTSSGSNDCDALSDPHFVETIANSRSLTVDTNWSTANFPSIGTDSATDTVLSLTSDGADIYLFYVKDPGTNSLVWRKCSPGGGGDTSICDNSADWGSENTLDSGTDNTHPQAIVSKAFGDGPEPLSGRPAAIDVVYTTTTTPAVEYERHFVDSADEVELVSAAADDAYHVDCDAGASQDDQAGVGSDVFLGRHTTTGNCSDNLAEIHSGFRFPSVAVSQGARISSAYLDFRTLSRTGSGAVDFTVYGEDADSGATFSDFDNNCDSTCIGNRTRTTSLTTQSIDFANTNSYRIDVTNLVQEVVCRGASDAQPCVVGDFNGSGSWASGNALVLLLISSEGGGSSNYATLITGEASPVTLKPTLQINCAAGSCGTGNASQDFSAGVASLPTNASDLDHPLASAQFTSVNTDDTNFYAISASLVPSANSSAVPMFLFRANNTNNNNSDDLSAQVVVKSTIPTKSYGNPPHPSGKTICFQLYDNTAAAWETFDCNGPGTASVCSDGKSLTCDTGVAPETDITLDSGNITGAVKWYAQGPGSGSCSGNDCWAAWRVYQEPAPEANQILYADFFSPTFVPERVLWLLPLALFLPRILPKIFPGFRRRREAYVLAQPPD